MPDPPVPDDGPRASRAALPLVGAQAASGVTREDLEAVTETPCSLDDGCITCGDVAVPLTVVEVTDADARCRDAQGREELVATELVGAVAPGDVLLVHAGVALEQLDPTVVRHDR